MQHVHAGKVRDLYSDNGDLLLVASDRVSVYDVLLPTPIPDKGALLTQLSVWWFELMADVVPNHLLSATDVPAEFGRRAIRCKPLKMLPVECIVRGHLAGLGLREYQRDGAISGVALPDGLVEGDRLPEPIFTPTTKASEGHDEFITFDDVVNEIGEDTADRLRKLSIEIYTRGAKHAAEAGVIIADTKFEFGLDDGDVVLADEVLTPDSSRFWPADRWVPGTAPPSLDKQFVRDWLDEAGWDRNPPPPDLAAGVVDQTRRTYVEAYERLTGTAFSSWSGS